MRLTNQTQRLVDMTGIALQIEGPQANSDFETPTFFNIDMLGKKKDLK